MPKKKTRLAIGGKIVGAKNEEPPITEAGAASVLKDENGNWPPQQPPRAKKKHRLAIGGRLY